MVRLNEHELRNRRQWDTWAPNYADAGRRAWAKNDPEWGMWAVPESELNALSDIPTWSGVDVLELGCGTAYFGSWLARRGARVTGIDNSPAQLENARRFQREFSLEFHLQLGTAESLPYDDGSFDVALSEYGASIWCDPYRWIPEAARVLRPGGSLIFLVNTPLVMMCTPLDGSTATTTLHRPQFDMLRFEWPDDDDSVEFHLPHGKMIDLLRTHSMRVERLIEIQAPADAASPSSLSSEYVTAEWARNWPCEEIWVTRKCAPTP